MYRFPCALILSLALVLAGQTGVKTVPVQPAPAPPGEQMYKTYCASCHGLNGKGGGPAAPAMKAPVPDLTLLARDNGGKYPRLKVLGTINGDVSLAAHGSKAMPVWGYVFREMKSGAGAEADLRVRNLVNYIESLQVK